jgi:flagellar biogenesis protein FliO
MEGGVLFSVARTLLALLGVCALAWVALNLLARRGVGVARPGARLRLLERLSLGPRRQLYLVQADSRVFLLGMGDSGGLALIAELDARAQLTDAGGG